MNKLGGLADSIKDATENVIDKIDDKFDMPIIIDFVGIKRAGDECYTSARETSGLCQITIEKANEMVSFGQELSSTLNGICSNSNSSNNASTKSRGIDASKFAIIQDLVDGDRMKAATQLANELSELSLECVTKSTDMISSMERGIDALPDVIEPFVQNKMDKSTKKGSNKNDPTLPDIDRSVSDMKQLISDVEEVNLLTIVPSGLAAFVGLQQNGELSKEMFLSISNFASNVESVTSSFRTLNDDQRDTPKEMFQMIKTIAKDSWRCLRLSGLMKVFAEKVRVIMKYIISLFHIAAKKLGEIWGSLSNAREIVGGCIIQVKESIRLCDISKTKSLLLHDTTKEILNHLKVITQFGNKGGGGNKSRGGGNPAERIASFVELADGEEILLCISLATGIDDMFSDCTHQVIKTIDNVDGAIRSMPDVLTQDITSTAVDVDGDDDGDVDGNEGGIENTTTTTTIDDDGNDFDEDDEEDVERKSRGGIDFDGGDGGDKGRSSSNTKKIDVANDVQELNTMRKEIEDANMFTLIQRSVDGFHGVNDKMSICNDMITTSKGYATTSLNAINSFQNESWDLEVATQHIRELFEIRDSGTQMKRFIESVLELIRANLELLQVIRSKSKGGGSGGDDSSNDDIVGQLSDVVKPGGIKNLAASFANDLDVDDLKGIGQGIKKFGSLFKK